MPEGNEKIPQPVIASAERPLHHDLDQLTFFAVDSEDTHNLYRDPDDAFAMKKLRDGSMLLHVAVVDSTAIPLGSPSDRMAANRGSSMYHPSYVPMLHKHWYEDIGLWDGKRAAIVTTVHLSPRGKVIGTWFTRQEINVESLTHRQAGELMGKEKHPLHAMALAMKTFQKQREERTQRIHVDPKTGLEVGLEGNVSAFLPDAPGLRAVHNLIQETMILANTAVAEWTRNAGLPFIYRNHGSEVPNFDIGTHPSIAFDVRDLRRNNKKRREEAREKVKDFILIKAQYNAHCYGHIGIGIEAYAHTTSPLRRYVDIVNQKMMGFAMGVMDKAENLLAGECPNTDINRIREVLWKEAQHLIDPIYSYQTEKTRNASLYTREIEDALTRCFVKLRHPQAIPAGFAEALLDEANNPLPYRLSDLEQLAEYTNRILEIPQAEKKRLSIERIDSWLRRVIRNPNPEILRSASTDEFTNLVKRAAVTGQMNAELFHEIQRRIEEHRGIRPIVTYASILAKAPNDDDVNYADSDKNGKSYWKKLKQEVLDELKFDAGTVDDVFQNIQDMMGENFSVVMENKDLRDSRGQAMHCSLCVAKIKDKSEEKVLAPPSYVVMPEGHASLARANARYHFLECLAAKSLVPIEEVSMPDTMSASIRRVIYPLDLLTEIAKRHGIDYKITQTEWRSGRREDDPIPARGEEDEPARGYSASIELSGAKVGELIALNPNRAAKYRTRQALWCQKKSHISAEDAVARAARNLLGKPEIESLLPRDIIVDYTVPEDPLKSLQAAEKQERLHSEFHTRRIGGSGHQRSYEISLVITRAQKNDTSPGAVLFSEQLISPDEQHARFELARSALRHLREQGYLGIGAFDASAAGQLSLFNHPPNPGTRVKPGQNWPPSPGGRQLT